MQAILKGDVLQRMASLGLIVSAVLLISVNAMFPRPADPTHTKGWLDAWAAAGSPFFQVLSLLLALGVWSVVIGAAGIYRSHTAGGAAAWTRLGFYGLLVGAALWTLAAANQIGISWALKDWAQSVEPAKGTLFLSISTHMQVTNAVFTMTVIAFWLALAFLGIGMILGGVYPAWSAWAITILGILTVGAVGIPQVVGGLSAPVTNVFFPVLAGLSSVWALVVGIWLFRRAW